MHNYDAAGRALTVMLAHTCLGTSGRATRLHLWPRPEGGWSVEWTGGPHAREVRADLVRAAQDPEVDALNPDDITLPWLTGDVPAVAVRGEVFALRPVGTVGVDAVAARA